jgi:single-stranded-DNA-specific exonuclease
MPAEVPLGPDVDPVLARVLYARHIDTSAQAAAFLGDESLDANPFDLAGMNEAVERLSRALAAGERIVVYGDFDTDGVTATVLLVSVLRQLGAQVEYYVPDRFSEAYGLNNEALRYLREERHADLVVTVDCGIRSSREVAYAHSLGLDVIVTDHHSVPAMLPPALAGSDPNREDCPSPFKSLAGVGVAYRLADALFRAGVGTGGAGALENYLDLVALGTVADVVPLVEENRRLVRRGLARMAHTERPGLRALMAVAGIGAAANDSPPMGATARAPRCSIAKPSAFAWRLVGMPPGACSMPGWPTNC